LRFKPCQQRCESSIWYRRCQAGGYDACDGFSMRGYEVASPFSHAAQQLREFSIGICCRDDFFHCRLQSSDITYYLIKSSDLPENHYLRLFARLTFFDRFGGLFTLEFASTLNFHATRSAPSSPIAPASAGEALAAASPQPKSPVPQSIIEWVTVTRRQFRFAQGAREGFRRVRGDWRDARFNGRPSGPRV